MKKIFYETAAVLLALAVFTWLVSGCVMQKKVQSLSDRQLAATINLPNEDRVPTTFRQVDTFQRIEKDTITVNIDGKEMIVMKAVRDDESGEMVATEQLNAAVITARFRNVAERHGKVDIQFEIRVPEDMYDSEWQLRFHPDMFIMEDSLRLEDVVITGENYRARQKKGYELYDKFISKIITDSTLFVDLRNLEIWLSRNIPQLYAYKTDSTEVSETVFESCLGVTEREAIDHYTSKFKISRNERLKAKRGKMWAKYIKAPIVTEGVRLDTVIRGVDGEFCYIYTETIDVRPKLRKVDVTIGGEIFQQEKQLYAIPRSEPLTYYISSLSSFVDNSERYLTKVISRRAEANAAWNIDFKVGKADIDPALGENTRMIANIRENLDGLLQNEVYDLDSITIAAFASPEGTLKANEALSSRRAESAVKYFGSYVRHRQDSIRREAGFAVTVGDDMAESGMTSAASFQEIGFRTSASGENWKYLDVLVGNDTLLTAAQKDRYTDLKNTVADLDAREKAMKGEDSYAYIKDALYPKLRTVQFNFFLHRHGMIQDTVHTTVLDSTYMRGVQAIRDRDYEAAVALLMPYNDYNTAIAYVSLDRNLSAMQILKDLKRTAPVNYMLAVLYSRQGDDRSAVECYLTSCKQDPSYVHRGNLDPEISALIKKYNLNAQPEEDEFEYSF